MKTLLRVMLALVLAVTFAALRPDLSGQAQAQEYRIRAGDRLTVEVLEDNSLNRTVAVLPGGTINFPYAGSLNVAGSTPSTVGNRIAQALSGVLAAPPTVFVTAVPQEPLPMAEAEKEVVNIYVMGEASAPGAKAVLPGTTFLQALSQAGGLSPFAATKRIQLRRARTPGQVIVVDYDAIMRGAVMNYDPVLSEGDVIVVPERRLFE
ncbi:MAG: polysaccharide biosynthesis/export family protein [Paracoccus sp. (in: a-proteobacteria)]|jgi:polysaccharide export outer membrane protein|nr:polysaccharide biosynthesis/export family protein [uncultured Paracoccus sp.]MAN56677.1 sugar transporter [Paracoccus sp. (in: a-proteobacteria)]MBA49344.1 sugar transporter [Paracoccus sp. (in: a-proteobacteria)]MCS5601261.1 polysaccharide export protein [Paracoccus sp. (in: a-proteobacteria)]HIC64874.1 polysaccharide export protein [Paracoccus sp. (in: a-proteobacteria)]|tara:strand:+ start:317 stop:937 length:621 start_codon:yes stop_codon:yes gene_type:complete